MLYFFFKFLDTKYIAAAPAYLTVILSVKLKLPAFTGEVYDEIKINGKNICHLTDNFEQNQSEP
jgi:hypothetical protein